jgi:hypothetical protein
MCPHTDQEWEELPHVLLTEDANWDPTHMDHEQGDDPAWYEQQDDPPLLNSDFDLCGDYCHCIVYKSNLTFVDAHSNEHDDTVRIQTLTQILIQVTMDHARYWRHHVIMMPFALFSPGFQPTSSRRLSRSPPSMHGCLSIPSFKNALSLPILRSTYNDVMNW